MDETWGEAPFINPAHGNESRGAGGHVADEFSTGEFSGGEFGEFGEATFLTAESIAAAHHPVDRWAETLGEHPWTTGETAPTGERVDEFEWSTEDEIAETAWHEAPGESAGEWHELGEGEFNELGEVGAMGEFGELGEDEWGEVDSPASGSPGPCADSTWNQQPWRVSRPGRHLTALGSAVGASIARRALVRELTLTDFDIDDYRLRPAHRDALQALASSLTRGLRSGRITAPVDVRVRGSASSTGTDRRNFELSRHRAWNVSATLSCILRRAGVVNAVRFVWTPVGEGVSQTVLGDSREASEFRGVKLLVIAPVRSCGCGGGAVVRPGGVPGVVPGVVRPGAVPGVVVPGPRAVGPVFTPGRMPGGPMRSGRTSASLCFSVTSLRRAPAASVPLVRLPGIPGVALPSLTARRTVAQIKVVDHRRRRVAPYEVRGIALIIRGGSTAHAGPLVSGSLAAMLRLPGLGLSARVGGRLLSATGRVIADALRQGAISGRCQPVRGRSLIGHPATRLGGPAILVIPAGGAGQPLLQLSPAALRSRGVVITPPTIPVRSVLAPRRSTVVLIGSLRRSAHAFAARETHETESNAWELGEAGRLDEFGNEQTAMGEWGEMGEHEMGNEFANEFTNEFSLESEFSNEFEEIAEFGNEFGNEFNELEFGNESSEWQELGEWTEHGVGVP